MTGWYPFAFLIVALWCRSIVDVGEDLSLSVVQCLDLTLTLIQSMDSAVLSELVDASNIVLQVRFWIAWMKIWALRSRVWTLRIFILVCGRLHSPGTLRTWTCTVSTISISALPNPGIVSRPNMGNAWNDWRKVRYQISSENCGVEIYFVFHNSC